MGWAVHQTALNVERPPALGLTEQERKTVEPWIAARIVLLAAEKVSNRATARQLGTTQDTVILWRQRFTLGRTLALTEEVAGRGRKPTIGADQVKRIVETTLHTTPANATPWSVRTMAQA